MAIKRRPRVFIAQEPMRKDANGRWVSKGLDIASANEYGEIIIIWGPESSIMSRNYMEAEALKAADAYDELNDYVVALGSPTLISILAWAIGSRGKMLRVLEWDRSMQRYYPTLGASLDDIVT